MKTSYLWGKLNGEQEGGDGEKSEQAERRLRGRENVNAGFSEKQKAGEKWQILIPISY